MNFLKNSIFSRGAGDSSPDWEPENENQMLAVWGSPGSGKTTTAVKLAARLAMQKKDVALLLCDMNTPMLPCICPPGDLEEEHSLGSVLAATHTKPLFSIPTHQFLFNAGSIDAKFYTDTLQLEDSEYNLIRYPQRGVCLYKCGNERYNLMVNAPEHKARLFGKAGGR